MMKTILAIHIAAGAAALAAMAVPLASRKGGVAHRRAGWVFVAGMAAVSVTSLLLGAERFVSNPWPGARDSAIFLSYLGVLTGGLVSSGIRVLRFKSRTSAHRDLWDLALAGFVTFGAVALGVYGLAVGRPLFVAFSLIGLFSGGSQLAYWLAAPAHPLHWWFAHLNLMLGACVAATTAFVVNNVGRLGVSSDSVLVWVAPTLLGVPAGILWTRYYGRRFAAIAPVSIPSRRTPAMPQSFFPERSAPARRPLKSKSLGPDWVRTARFDMVAQLPDELKPTTSMLQNLRETGAVEVLVIDEVQPPAAN